MKTLAFLTFFSVLSFSCLAEGNLIALYKEKTKEFLTAAEKSGVSTIGKCELRLLDDDNWDDNCAIPFLMKDDLDEIEFIELENFNKVNGATRWGAFCDPQNKTIYLNKAVKHDPEFIGVVGLHEMLCLKRRKDSEFQLSMGVKLKVDLYQEKDHSQEIDFKDGFLTGSISLSRKESQSDSTFENNSILELNGGGVLVGGGGDTATIKLRYQIYRNLYSSLNFRYKMFYSQTFREIRAEIIEADEGEVQYIIKNGKLNLILVPSYLLNLPAKFNLSLDNQAVDDIFWFYHSVYPTKFKANNPYNIKFQYNEQCNSLIPLRTNNLHPLTRNLKYCSEGKI